MSYFFLEFLKVIMVNTIIKIYENGVKNLNYILNRKKVYVYILIMLVASSFSFYYLYKKHNIKKPMSAKLVFSNTIDSQECSKWI